MPEGREVDDGQAAVPEGDCRQQDVCPHAGVVRAPMGKRGRPCAGLLSGKLIALRRLKYWNSRDATHASVTPSGSTPARRVPARGSIFVTARCSGTCSQMRRVARRFLQSGLVSSASSRPSRPCRSPSSPSEALFTELRSLRQRCSASSRRPVEQRPPHSLSAFPTPSPAVKGLGAPSHAELRACATGRGSVGPEYGPRSAGPAADAQPLLHRVLVEHEHGSLHEVSSRP